VLVVIAATVILAAITAIGCDEYFASGNVTVSFIPPIIFGIVMWFWSGLVALAMWLFAKHHPGSLRFSIKVILA
jgi:hypothetical protein